MSNNNSKTPTETAYAYLTTRMRTVSEVEKHLRDKGFSEDEVRETVNDLIGLRYLDDYQYAVRYYEYNREKLRGTLRASRELAEKGVDPETIKNARDDFLFSNEIDEFEDALAVAMRMLEENRNPGELPELCDDQEPSTLKNPVMNDKLAAKIGRKLENKGFGRDIIFRVLERIR